MPWIKDTSSEAPKVVYVAPEDALPMKRIIFNPNPAENENPWVIEYAFINTPESTLEDIEQLMGLT
jgi:hypothetical protein